MVQGIAKRSLFLDLVSCGVTRFLSVSSTYFAGNFESMLVGVGTMSPIPALVGAAVADAVQGCSKRDQMLCVMTVARAKRKYQAQDTFRNQVDLTRREATLSESFLAHRCCQPKEKLHQASLLRRW